MPTSYSPSIRNAKKFLQLSLLRDVIKNFPGKLYEKYIIIPHIFVKQA